MIHYLLLLKDKSMRENNARIGLYHHAMRNNNVNENRLIEGVFIIAESGIVSIINLQGQGYHYIKL